MTRQSVVWDDIEEGTELPARTREITRTTIIATAIATRDFALMHHDHIAAQKSGAKDIFLNIISTGGLVGKYLTDWSGPEGRLKKLTIRLGATCFPGDTLTSAGKIVKKYIEDNQHLVDVDYNLSVKSGAHAMGTVTLALPARR